MPSLLLMLAGNLVFSAGLALDSGDAALGIMACGCLLMVEGIAVGMLAYLAPGKGRAEAPTLRAVRHTRSRVPPLGLGPAADRPGPDDHRVTAIAR